MLSVRVIPVLLYNGSGLVKSVKFKDHKYVGDPINAVKIFNDKEVDELVLLDISATPNNREPKFQLIADVASECFMPMCYGGGIRGVEDVKRIIKMGVEKVCINTAAIVNPGMISEATDIVGSQSIVVSIDAKRSNSGRYEILSHCGKSPAGIDLIDMAIQVERLGAGEIMLNSIDRDGTMQGYDIDLIRQVTDAVNIPVIACGGAGKIEDFSQAISCGRASAVAGGSFFVFYGKHRAVLINYPTQEQLMAAFSGIR